MCRDSTISFSKIAMCGKGEKKYENIQVIWTILLKISNLEANLEIFNRIVQSTCIFSYFFSPFPQIAIFEKKNLQSLHNTHTKLHVQAKKSPFLIFIGYVYDVWLSLPGFVKPKGYWILYFIVSNTKSATKL